MDLNRRVIIIYLITLITVPLLQVLLLALIPSIQEQESTLMTFQAASNLVWYVTLTALLFITASRYLFKNQWVIFVQNKKRVLFLIALGVALMFTANILINGFFVAIGHELNPENQANLERIAQSGAFSVFSLVIFAGFLAPITEEIVFRKGVYGLFEKKYGNIVAIIINSFFFGLIHVLLDLSNFINILPYFGLGIVLSYMYYYSGKLIFVPIFMHMIMNLISLITMFFIL